ncbi:MAG: flavoprotein [Carbonactinosporaceae bacterium]
MTRPATTRVLYLIVCGAGPASHAGRPVERAHARGWDVHVIATPAALDFVDLPALEAQTGHPLRSRYTRPGKASSTRSLPHAHAIVVAPATYNTINKWASGVSDTFALGILAEAIGLRVPVVVLPFVNAALAAHPAFRRSLAVLRQADVHILHGPGGLEPHEPGTGQSRLDSFPWEGALDEAERLRSQRERNPGERKAGGDGEDHAHSAANSADDHE